MIQWHYRDVVARLARIEAMLKTITNQEAKMAVDLSALTAEVTANTQVEQSVVTLINNLAAQIAELKTGSTDAATQAAIDALVAQLKGNDQALAKAVTDNTPTPATP